MESLRLSPATEITGAELKWELVGFEGMSGLAVVLGNDRSPNENFMQVAGDGRRISAGRLRLAMQESRSMQGVFLNFAHALMN